MFDGIARMSLLMMRLTIRSPSVELDSLSMRLIMEMMTRQSIVVHSSLFVEFDEIL